MLLRLLMLRVSSQVSRRFDDLSMREHPPPSETGSSKLEELFNKDEAGVVLDDGPAEVDRSDDTVPLRILSLLSLLPASKAAKSAA